MACRSPVSTCLCSRVVSKFDFLSATEDLCVKLYSERYRKYMHFQKTQKYSVTKKLGTVRKQMKCFSSRSEMV